MDDGYVMINRKLFTHWIWEECKHKFSWRDAWIDMIQQACYRDSAKRIIKGKLIAVKRGELIASRNFLMERWGWSNTKVDNFLDLLESDAMITREKRRGENVIMLCNFGRYNNAPTSETQEKRSKTTGDQQVTNDTPTIGTHKTNKERKKKRKNTIPDGIDTQTENQKSQPQKMYDVFMLRYQKLYPGEIPNLEKKDWAAFNHILNKIKRRIVNRDPDLVNIKQVEFHPALENYAAFLDSVIELNDQWYIDNFTPCLLNSKFTEIVNKILNRKNGQRTRASKTVLDPQTATGALERLMAKDRRRSESG